MRRHRPLGDEPERIASLDEPAQALYGVATTGDQSGKRLDATIASDRVVPPLVAFAFLQRSFTGGLTVGASRHDANDARSATRNEVLRAPSAARHRAACRLRQRLDARRDAKLTLVAAPAGFGKTTLAR